MSAASASTPVFRAEGVSVHAGGRTLIDGFSLTLNPGEIVALHGPSGCGKTTLLRALAGLIDLAAGRITLGDKPAGEGGWPEYRRLVVYVPQEPVMPAGTVRAQLRLPFDFRTARGARFDEAEAERLLQRMALAGAVPGQEAASLSVGQRQRVGLARALLLQPAALLLDEPTSALDEEAAEATRNLLREETDARGAAALAVLHDRRQGASWADRVIDLADTGALAPGLETAV